MKNWRNYALAALVGALVLALADPRPQASYGLAIKQIQCGDVAVNNGNTSGTSTLSNAVVVAKSVLVVNGWRGGTNAVDQLHTSALTDATTVTATRNGTTGNAAVAYCVVEYY